MSFPTALAGHWAYAAILDLDRFAPGLAGDMLRASPARRQIACAVLSRPDRSAWPDAFKAELAAELRFAKGGALIADRFGDDPTGLRDCLAKMRDCYGAPEFYEGLYRLYADPAAAAARRRLAGKRVFDAMFVETVPQDLVGLRQLGEAFLHHRLVARIGRPWRTSDIERAARFLRRFEPGMPDGELVDVLIAAGTRAPIEAALARYPPLRHTSPRSALAGLPGFELLTGQAQMQRIAGEFRNCLDEPRFTRMANQKANLLVAWRGQEEKAVMHLARLGELWRVVDLKGVGNSLVSPATLDTLAAILEPFGILCPHCPFDLPW